MDGQSLEMTQREGWCYSRAGSGGRGSWEPGAVECNRTHSAGEEGDSHRGGGPEQPPCARTDKAILSCSGKSVRPLVYVSSSKQTQRSSKSQKLQPCVNRSQGNVELPEASLLELFPVREALVHPHPPPRAGLLGPGVQMALGWLRILYNCNLAVSRVDTFHFSTLLPLRNSPLLAST